MLKNIGLKKIGLSVLALSALLTAPALAGEPIKLGVSVGLTGYAASADIGWRDGVLLAIDAVNARGGVMGRKLQAIVEDNHSQPLDAVEIYRKMISSDKVDIFTSGVLSAGNFAAAPMVVKAEIPMVIGSILPTPPDQVKWAFTPIPPPRFEVETRLEYLRDSTKIRKFAVLHDPSPYANLQATIAQNEAKQYGLTMVDNEQYRHDDSDFSVQVGKMNAAGAGAIVKVGLGGSTLTVAKDIKQLGLDTPLLTALETVEVFRPVAQVMGDKFFFVAGPAQVYDLLPSGPLKDAIKAFITPWRAKYGERDPNWAVRGWDAVMIAVAGMEQAKTTKGPAVRDAIERLHGFQGAGGVFNFSPDNHFGLTQNSLLLAQIINGKVVIVK